MRYIYVIKDIISGEIPVAVWTEEEAIGRTMGRPALRYIETLIEGVDLAEREMVETASSKIIELSTKIADLTLELARYQGMEEYAKGGE